MPDWLRDTQWLWWVGAALAFGIVEMNTLDLIFLMLPQIRKYFMIIRVRNNFCKHLRISRPK